MFSNALLKQAARVLFLCKKRRVKLTTAESCTGGLIMGLLTEISGSAKVVECGYITYSNEAKQALLGVKDATLKKYGAVSAEVATEMAQGARKKAGAGLAVSVTGIAGPTGGTKAKPVGLVYVALAYKDFSDAEEHHFKGNRAAVRLASVKAALGMIERRLS